jgi:hypothetical protein
MSGGFDSIDSRSFSSQQSTLVVDLGSTAKQTVFTVPSGKQAVVLNIMYHTASTSLGASAATLGCGFDAGGVNNSAAALLTAVTATTVAIPATIIATRTVGVAGDTFGAKPGVADSGKTIRCTVFYVLCDA